MKEKEIIHDIAKHQPSVIIKAYNILITSKNNRSITWKDFPWYDSILSLIKDNKMLYAISELQRFSISQREAESIVNEIKRNDTEPTLPIYMKFEKNDNLLIVKFAGNIICQGTDKFVVSEEAWKWHGKHVRRQSFFKY